MKSPNGCTMALIKQAPWILCLALTATACGSGADLTDTADDLEIDVSTLPLPPAGSDAQLISHNIPTQMNPGERLNVQVVMRNTGISTGGSNVNWDNNNYALYRINTAWSWTYTRVTPTVAACNGGVCGPANDATYNFVITAPAANPSATYSARMRILGDTPFGDTVSVTGINVNPANQRRWSCALVSSDIPASMAPGEARTVNVTVTNDGTATWPATGACFVSRDQALGLPPAEYHKWGSQSACVPLTSAVAPGGQFTFTFPITAPATVGNQTIVRQITDNNPVSTTGGVGLFSATLGCLNQTVNVTNAVTPDYDAAVVSQSIPSPVTAGTFTTFEVTMQNTGTQPWTGSAFALRTDNTPSNLWTTGSTPLGAAETVAPGASRTFTFSVRAPAAPGLYTSQWRMTQTPGIGVFGTAATTNNVQVIVGSCSNRITEAAEECDDGNVINGDGCSASCIIEPRAINLANTPADRGELGPHARKKYSNVEIGDVTGDGVPEVLMGGTLHVYPPVGSNRALAGAVHIFSGTGFFTGANETAPGTASVQIWGAEPNDELGGNRDTAILVGDVTGDGIGDLVTAAAAADGANNGRPGSGEIFVIAGAADLLTAGTIDLRADPISTRVVAHIVGAAAGDALMALTIADLNNDGNQDLVMGVPGRDGPNGADAGGFVVLAGPILGEIDLSAATPLTVIDGPVAGLRLGPVGTSGDFSRDGVADFLFGVRAFSNGGFNARGVACGFFGRANWPANINLISDPCDVTWLGDGANTNYGASVAIANVVGTADNDVVIGGVQIRKGGVQVGGVDVWDTNFFQGLFFDLAGAPPSIRILGDNPGDQGGSVLALGDMNGDGYADVPFVASSADGPLNDQDGNGEVEIVLGGPTLTGTIDLSATTPPLVMYGAAARDLMGSHPHSIAFGDIDNDGRADFCIGSHQGGTVGANVAPGRIDCVRSQW